MEVDSDQVDEDHNLGGVGCCPEDFTDGIQNEKKVGDC